MKNLPPLKSFRDFSGFMTNVSPPLMSFSGNPCFDCFMVGGRYNASLLTHMKAMRSSNIQQNINQNWLMLLNEMSIPQRGIQD